MQALGNEGRRSWVKTYPLWTNACMNKNGVYTSGRYQDEDFWRRSTTEGDGDSAE
jgi:hypothetical protein